MAPIFNIIIALALATSLISQQPFIRSYRAECSVSDVETWGITWSSRSTTPVAPWTFPDLPAAILINGAIWIYPTYAPHPGTGLLFFTSGNGFYRLQWRPLPFLIGIPMFVEFFTTEGSSRVHFFTIVP